MLTLEVLGLFFFAAFVWFWLDSLKAREAAVGAARAACSDEGLLFLDDTVAAAGLKLVRDAHGRIGLQRAYDFEFSDTGNNRRPGAVVVVGRRVVLLNLGPSDAYASDSQY